MIYLISDLHGETSEGLSRYISDYRSGDLLIILGDVGLNFENTDKNRKFTEYFLSIDKPIAFVEGNHENHSYLNSFSEEVWCGGVINRLTEHVVRLKRGNIFTIENKTLFVMGGCKSSPKWKEMGLWFDGEEPSAEEIALAYANLQRRENRVDYVLTHKYHPDMRSDVPLTLDGLKEYIDKNVDFKHWYAGHWHRDRIFDDRHTIVFDHLLPLR